MSLLIFPSKFSIHALAAVYVSFCSIVVLSEVLSIKIIFGKQRPILILVGSLKGRIYNYASLGNDMAVF
jgi:hypothetical protein